MRRRPPLRARLAALPAGRLALFLDYDGTLAPIARHPDDARLPAPVRRTLRLLARSVPVVVVSGRGLSDLQRRVGLTRVRYVAHHGLVYKRPRSKVRWLGQPVARREVRHWVRALERAAEGIGGAFVEDKGVGVALHDRLVSPGDRARLRRRARRALAPWLVSQRITLVRGKRVLEVRPAGSWNKGVAVTRLLKEWWAQGRVPVYFGDDRTDFDAFRVLRRGGVSVRVGGRRGVAGEDAWLSGPEAVLSFLRWLQERTEAANPHAGTAGGKHALAGR